MLNFRSADALDGSIHSVKIRFTYRNDPLENQVISEFRWVRIKRKSGSILLDNQQKGIKTAQATSKAAIKTTETSVKTAQVAARASAKTAQKAAQAAKVTAKATAEATKATVRATIAAVKAIIAGTKALISALIAGGWIAVVIILIVVLLAVPFPCLAVEAEVTPIPLSVRRWKPMSL